MGSNGVWIRYMVFLMISPTLGIGAEICTLSVPLLAVRAFLIPLSVTLHVHCLSSTGQLDTSANRVTVIHLSSLTHHCMLWG